jgi:hypothetical protein
VKSSSSMPRNAQEAMIVSILSVGSIPSTDTSQTLLLYHLDAASTVSSGKLQSEQPWNGFFTGVFEALSNGARPFGRRCQRTMISNLQQSRFLLDGRPTQRCQRSTTLPVEAFSCERTKVNVYPIS